MSILLNTSEGKSNLCLKRELPHKTPCVGVPAILVSLNVACFFCLLSGLGLGCIPHPIVDNNPVIMEYSGH